MIKVENVECYGFEAAIRGMRNPKNSWHLSDSYNTYVVDALSGEEDEFEYFVGEKDLDLMKRLCKAGNEHRKFLRMIHVSFDLTCNHFFWAEMDTYKVGVTRNSCSKMHKIHVKEFVKDDFSHEGIDAVDGTTKNTFELVIQQLEYLRQRFNDTKEKKYWRAMLELLPMGFNIRATIDMNYENVLSIIKQRSNHKVDEWNQFTDILKELPYIKELIADE